jgi:DNA-binding transcriptional MerR regulator
VNQTKNQHFISQVEQRLNAYNPDAARDNQRIYEFEIVDRDKRILKLVDARGRSIKNNLAMLDLFSFDVDKDKNTRANFEEAFHRYERQVRPNTERILLAHSTTAMTSVPRYSNCLSRKW